MKLDRRLTEAQDAFEPHRRRINILTRQEFEGQAWRVEHGCVIRGGSRGGEIKMTPTPSGYTLAIKSGGLHHAFEITKAAARHVERERNPVKRRA